MRSALILAVFLLAGCAQIEPEGSNGDVKNLDGKPVSEDTNTGGLPEGCELEVAENGNGFTAWCVVDYPVTPSHQHIILSTVNGDIDAHEGSKNQATVTYWGDGETEQEAVDRLASMSMRDRDGYIQIIIEAPKWNKRGAHIELQLIEADQEDLLADTTNGEITVKDFSNGQLDLDTTNGDIIVHAQASEVVADTTNGAITIDGSVSSAYADTTNGEIDFSATPTTDATWEFYTTNGVVNLRFKEGPEIAYFIEAETTNGAITIDMKETEDNGEQKPKSRNVQTKNWQSRDTHLEVITDTTNGAITITGT